MSADSSGNDNLYRVRYIIYKYTLCNV
jgi:hypothetical protein